MEALLYSSENSKVRCNLCNHFCLISENERGICGVRENKGGVLHSLVYDKIIAASVDPIEKKPLYHFLPGSLSYSIAAVGCNFRCSFCQNHDIAQMVKDRGIIAGENIKPEDIVKEAGIRNCGSISYTYTEPTIYFEKALETSKLAQKKGIKNIFVSNGYMSTEAIEMITPFLDAANIDLKSFSDDFYKIQCGAKIEPVLKNLITIKESGIHLEITTLVIPGLNDSEDQLNGIIEFILKKLGPDTPWHVSRFHPTYKLTKVQPTSPDFLINLRREAMAKGLKYVYTGNIIDSEGSETFCSKCGSSVIKRDGYRIFKNFLKEGKCRCGEAISGIFER